MISLSLHFAYFPLLKNKSVANKNIISRLNNIQSYHMVSEIEIATFRVKKHKISCAQNFNSMYYIL